MRVWRCVYDVSGSPELSQCQLTKDLLKACFKMALKRVGFGVCARMCVCMQVSTRVCVFVIERLSLCMRGFCCCCISQCPVHLEGYGRPLDRPGMLAKHFSSICVCVCVCHFEGGKNLTVIKVKRPTVLVRGRGEKESERGVRGKREMDR